MLAIPIPRTQGLPRIRDSCVFGIIVSLEFLFDEPANESGSQYLPCELCVWKVCEVYLVAIH
jgi:hypothetical protein